MPFHFHFRDIQERADLKELIDFLAFQDLGYPRYEEWVQRAEHELDIGYQKNTCHPTLKGWVCDRHVFLGLQNSQNFDSSQKQSF